MPPSTPALQTAAFDSVVRDIVDGIPRQLSDGLDIGDALWAMGVLGRLVSAVRVFRDLPGTERKLTVMRSWEAVQAALPANYRKLKSDAADRLVEVIYSVGSAVGVF